MDLVFYLLTAVAAVGLFAIAVALYLKRDRRQDREGRAPPRRRDRNAVLREATRRLDQDARDAQALRDLAEISFEDQDFKRSYGYYKSLVALCGINPEIDEFAANLRLGQSALKLNKVEEAHKHLLLARTIRENEFEVNLNLGILEFARKDFPKACSYLSAAHSQRPDDVATNRYLGYSYYAVKQQEAAVEALQRVLDFQPEDKKTQFVLAKCYFALKQNDLALKIFSLLRTDPNLGAISALHAGILHLSTRKIEAALEDFEIGLRHENVDLTLILELKYRMAEAYLKQGELSAAIRLWKEIVSLRADYKDAAARIRQYQEINTNRYLQIFLLAPSSEFITLCRKLCLRYFPNSKTKLINIALHRAEYADILASVRTPQWEDLVLFRYVRSQGAIGELLLRDLYARTREVRAGRSVCMAPGSFSEQALSFVEARMMDLVAKEDLLKILNRI